jgi:hypothetical protein
MGGAHPRSLAHAGGGGGTGETRVGPLDRERPRPTRNTPVPVSHEPASPIHALSSCRMQNSTSTTFAVKSAADDRKDAPAKKQ